MLINLVIPLLVCLSFLLVIFNKGFLNEEKLAIAVAIFSIACCAYVGWIFYSEYLTSINKSLWNTPIVLTLVLAVLFISAVLSKKDKKNIIVIVSLVLCLITSALLPLLSKAITKEEANTPSTIKIEEGTETQETEIVETEAKTKKKDEDNIRYMSVGEVVDYLKERELETYLIIGTEPSYPFVTTNYVYLTDKDLNSGNYNREQKCSTFTAYLYNDNWKEINDYNYSYTTHLFVINGTYILQYDINVPKNNWIMVEDDLIYVLNANDNSRRTNTVRGVNAKEPGRIYAQTRPTFRTGNEDAATVRGKELTGIYNVEKINKETLKELCEKIGIEQKEKKEKVQEETPFLLVDDMPESSLKEQLSALKEAGFLDGSIVGFRTLDVNCKMTEENQFTQGCYLAKEVEIKLEGDNRRYLVRTYEGRVYLLDRIDKKAYVAKKDIFTFEDIIFKEGYNIEFVETVDTGLLNMKN